MRIDEFVANQSKEKVAAVKKRLLECVSTTNDQTGGVGASEKWITAINELDSNPKKLLSCDPLLHTVVKAAFSGT